ncbi:MAG: metallophosphoesterase [Alphaproteobacteria bacterium]
MKKIIHLSDLHIGLDDCARRMGLLVQAIAFAKKPASNYVIVITGDIVNNAFDSSLIPEALSFIKKLKDSGYDVLIAPGNHDYGSGALADKDLVAPFKKAFFGDPKQEFPKLDIIDGVAFVGIDSMKGELGFIDRIGAEGEITSKQLGKLDEILKRKDVQDCAKRVVYLHHHPFDPRPFHGLKDSAALENVLKDAKVSALLYGHNHDGGVWNGTWGIPRCYDGSSSTGARLKPTLPRVIDLEKDPRWDYQISVPGL